MKNQKSKYKKGNFISGEIKRLLFPDKLSELITNDSLNQISNPYFINSFKRADPLNTFSESFEQSVESYILSKKRRRKEISSQNVENRTIVLANVILTTKKSLIKKYSKIIDATSTLMRNFFKFDVKIDRNLVLKIKKSKDEYYVFDGSSNTKYPLRYNAEFNTFNVFYFLYVLPKFINDKALSFIFFTDVNLYETSPKNEIFGRVLNLSKNYALVSLNNDLDSETMITALHETLHTFGLSHCNYWDCIMNAKNDCNNYSSINLCPLDLIKLKIFNNSIEFTERYKSLESNFKDLGWGDDQREMKLKISLLQKKINISPNSN